MRITYLPSVDQNRASSRYRQLIPGQELEKLGHTVYYVEARRNSEWVIVNKAVDDEFQKSAWTGYRKVCFDMCDNHFITKYRQNHISMCMRADLITCSTVAMADEIYKHTKKVAQVIPDPYEYDIIAPVNVNELESLFWHGNNLSAPALEKVGRISTHPHVQINIGNFWYNFNAVGADLLWSAKFSKDTTERYLADSDACIVPVEDDEWAKCKSPNRLMNVVARGKFVIANPMPAYMPFKDSMYIGDIVKGLQWTKENLKDLPRRIIQAQDYLIKNHSPQVIGKKWEKTLGLT